MTKTQKSIQQYCQDHTSPPSLILQDLERQTYLKTLAPQMISGYFQGRLLSMLSQMIRPKTILEIGTFTGYSAICLAEGLLPNGKLHTIEVNPEYHSLSQQYFVKAVLSNMIEQYLGDALTIIPRLNLTFDLVFIDASKVSYPLYFDLIFEKTSGGGYILVDNMLWSGKVLEDDDDPETNALRNFAKKLQDDTRLENILLPIRDGLMICRKT
ncbi:MAG: class I SAM-dependent methyltransferase [Saprospiraceae bacterium]|nr:class I SAM-dependent methyltransferase [Saprospiraceae bacterium]